MTVGRQLGQNDQAIGSRCKGVLCFLGKTGNYFILLTAFQGLFQSTKIGMRGGSEEQYFPAAVKHLYEYGRSVILFSDLAFDWFQADDVLLPAFCCGLNIHRNADPEMIVLDLDGLDR